MARAGVADVGDVMAHVTAAVVAGADPARLIGEPLALPTVHLLAGDLDQPYVGYVRCRDFTPGRDAASALGLLGRLPAAVAATHVVFVWDVARVRAALEPSGPRAPEGLAIVEASLTDHIAHWLPVGEKPAEWGEARVYPSGRLPVPIDYALRSWRSLVDDDVPATVDMLERAGYLVRWAARS